ncbi:MAG: rep 2, partial [Microbacterium sp.]|nr:rep 2 [Microbacterium sp.]
PTDLTALGRRHDVPVWAALADFLVEYEDVRANLRTAYRDAAGLTDEAVALVRTLDHADPAFAAVRRLRAVLVDDAQELTLGGVALLEALHGRGVAVTAFGDPDLGSGVFRGARPEHFARLAGALGGATVLGTVHRGTPMQEDVVRAVTQRIGAAGIVAHRAPPRGADDDGSVRVLTARSATEEHDAIARVLRERHLHGGVPWGRCAVIAHDSRQVATLEAELSAREVPARAPGLVEPLGRRGSVRSLVSVVCASADDADADPVEILLAAGFDPVDLRRLRAALRQSEIAAGGARPARELFAEALREPAGLVLLGTREALRAAKVAETLALLRAQLAEGASAHQLLWTAWSRSGYERAWAATARGNGPLAEQAGRDLDAVVALFQAAKRFGERAEDGGVANPMIFLRGVLDSDVAEDLFSAPGGRERVQVLTPTAALGLEFDTVVIAGMQDGVWPNTRLRGTLLQAWLDDAHAPSPFLELLPDAVAAPVVHPLSLRGLVAAHRRVLVASGATAAQRAHAAAQLALLADARVPGAAPSSWYGIAPPSSSAPLHDPRTESVRVSPSRVEALEQCELDWVIGDLGGDPGTMTAGRVAVVRGRGALGRARVRRAVARAGRARPGAGAGATTRALSPRVRGGRRTPARCGVAVRGVPAVPRRRGRAAPGALGHDRPGRGDRRRPGRDRRSEDRQERADHRRQGGRASPARRVSGGGRGRRRAGCRRADGGRSETARPAAGDETGVRDAHATPARRRSARRLPRPARRRGARHGGPHLPRALRGPLPRRLRSRALPHPHRAAGERPVSARIPAAAIAAALGQFPPTAEQTAVIESAPGPALVIAGAGSGKTETMAGRVVWLVANGIVRRDQVLGLTFTRKAAGELADRIQSRLVRLAEFERRGLLGRLPALHAAGELDVFGLIERSGAGERARLDALDALAGPDAAIPSLATADDLLDRPTVSTYNSFADSIVREHAVRIGRDAEAVVLSESAAWLLMRRVVLASDDPALDAFDGSVRTLVDQALRVARDSVDNLVDLDRLEAFPERFRDVLERPSESARTTVYADVRTDVAAVDRLALFARLAREYADRKRRLGVIDFADQVAGAYEIAGADAAVPAELRDRFRVVLLDEYQDTSVVQTLLLATLFGG